MEKWAASLGTHASSTRRAKKQLGQHWLTDPAALQAMADVAMVDASDYVIEVGAGTGRLTTTLTQRGATVVALERDAKLAEEVEQECGVLVSSASALRADIGAACDRLRMGTPAAEVKRVLDESDTRRNGASEITSDKSLPRAKVVANIPYYLTTDLLERLLPLGDAVSDVVVMVQREVAYRLAQPSAVSPSDYRPMSVMCQLYAETRVCKHVSRKSFHPPPEVESAIAHFSLRRPNEVAVVHVRPFMSFVKVSPATWYACVHY